MTVDDLLGMGLNPREFMASCVLLSRSEGTLVTVSVQELSEVLGCSYSMAAKTVAKLVEIGLFVRPARGTLLIRELSPVRVQEPSTLRGESSWLVSGDDMVDMSTWTKEEPDGSSFLGGVAPIPPSSGGTRKKVSIIPIEYDEPDPEVGIGRLPGDVPAPRRRRTRREEMKFHRLTPVEDWDVGHVVKEFRHRMTLARPDILGVGGNSKNLSAALSTWSLDHGLAVRDMVTAVEMFFGNDDLVRGLSESPAPYRVFLSFLQSQYRGITAAEIDDDWLHDIDAQLEELR